MTDPLDTEEGERCRARWVGRRCVYGRGHWLDHYDGGRTWWSTRRDGTGHVFMVGEALPDNTEGR